MKKSILFSLLFIFIFSLNAYEGEKDNLNFAVEYTSHATSFYYADAKKMFEKEDILVNDVKVYVSGGL